MAYHKDLTLYIYSDEGPSNASNIGWLELGPAFQVASPDPAFLGRLWEFCSISVARSRGFHLCPFCASKEPILASRDGQCLLLGSSEIRVFSKENGATYAAPNLIYHYIETHQYSPPIEFRRAVLEGCSPPEERYFAALATHNLRWDYTTKTLAPKFRFLPPGLRYDNGGDLYPAGTNIRPTSVDIGTPGDIPDDPGDGP